MLPEVGGFLADQKVLVTGVTGFVGLALVEKLLRTVPKISTVYVLIRPKRGKAVEERLDQIKCDPIFDTLKQEKKEDSLKKIIALSGNIDADNLGLSDEANRIIRLDVNYVFHCAATLDFEASLKTTMEINLLGTRKIVKLCKEMLRLKALVHVSSAYTNADKQSVKEELYPSPGKVEEIVDLIENSSELYIELVTPRLLDKHPNTYTFTKALAEHEVAQAFQDFPTCIIRPSMIVGAWKEPVPGWTNSKNGPQGFIMGAAMGVVRRLPVGKHLVYDYVPVDVVVNAIIVGAVHVASQKNNLKETPIFHCTTSTYKQFRWADVEDIVQDMLHKYPLSKAVWYPHLKLLPSIPRFRLAAFIFHIIPAYILDTLTKVAGGRPKLVRLHTAVNQSLERLEPFIFQEWHFDNSEILRLHQLMVPADQQAFGLDVGELEWKPFMENMAKGVRQYLHNEPNSTLPKALRKDKMLMVANILLQVFVFGMLYFTITGLFGVPELQAAAIIAVFYLLYSFL